MDFEILGWSDGSSFSSAQFEYLDWSDYDEEAIEKISQAVIEDIKKHGYKFNGEDMQDRENCMPVLNNYKLINYSRSGFGYLMAKAHGYNNEMDYCLFKDNISGVSGNFKVFPTGEFTLNKRESNNFSIELTKDLYQKVPVESINERFESTVEKYVNCMYLMPVKFDPNNYYWIDDNFFVFEKGNDDELEYKQTGIRGIFAYDNYEQFIERLDDIKSKYSYWNVHYDKEFIKNIAKNGRFLILALL